MTAAKPVLVGTFVLGGAALAVVAILLFGGTQIFRKTFEAVVYFPGSVAGVDVGAPVTFRGVRIGSVTTVAVKLDLKDLTARTPVYLEINPSLVSVERQTAPPDQTFDQLLHAGLRARLNPQSLVTGQLRVDLDLLPNAPPPAEPPPESDIPVIPAVPSTLETLEDEISKLPIKEIAERMRATLEALQNAADQLGPKVGPLLDNLTETSNAARDAFGRFSELAVEGKKQIEVNGDELAKLMRESEKTVHAAETTMTSLTDLTGPDSPMRGDLQAATRDLAASAGSLRGFSHEIERNPSAILFSKAAP